MVWTTPLRYERLSWPEVSRAVQQDRVCLIPVGTLEDHGPHLPLDCDIRIASEICDRAAADAPDEIVLLPPLTHGFTPHHMGFPGPITIGWKTFVDYAVDVGRSLARHGFKRILYLNGHGSNIPLIDMAARLVSLEHPDVLAAGAFYLTGEEAKRVIEDVRESGLGGMGHACELETSIYLAIDPEAVAMDRAVDENSFREGKHAWMDWSDGPLHLMPWWNAISHTGVHGDATKATAEKGRVLLDAAVKECVEFVRELREKPLPVRWEPTEVPPS
ncbi:MAG: creatininase family protein [Actinobacteria bacterium]|nr:creatininase family protein [Actinomycetota bacterium]